jgi:hypothetical protein
VSSAPTPPPAWEQCQGEVDCLRLLPALRSMSPTAGKLLQLSRYKFVPQSHPPTHTLTCHDSGDMDVDSDDDYDKVSVPEEVSDMESESFEAGARKNSSRSSSTPAATKSKPYCREKRLKCPYEGCDKAFNRPTRLQEHIRSHTNERPFKCPHAPCDKDYLRESHLKHHIKSAHSDVRDYKCSYEGCDKAFATGQRLKVHEATHEAPNKYRCTNFPPCNQVFRKKETLQRHIEADHHEQTTFFECEKVNTRTGEPCRRTFDTLAKLQAHDRTCHDPTRYSCDVCLETNPVTALGNPLTAANLSPSASKAFFTTYAELQEHLAVKHPPSCHLCHAELNTKKELTRHLEIVHGILDPQNATSELHKCPHVDCEKVFSRVGNLNVHIRSVHEKRRDYVCGQTKILIDGAEPPPFLPCEKAFLHKAGLIDHVRTDHLQMDSVQAAKRKASGVLEGPRPKKTRKDKGKRRVPAISGNTVDERFPFLAEDEEIEPDPFADDEAGELDGTMNMYGSMIYDPNGAYRYADGEYPTSSQGMDASTPSSFFDEEFEVTSEYFDPNPNVEHEEQPGPFLLEPEMSNALDPALFLSTPSLQRGLDSKPRFE